MMTSRIHKLSTRQMFYALVACALVTSVVLYMWIDKEIGSESFFSNFLQIQLNAERLKALMRRNDQYIGPRLVDPLAELFLEEHHMLHYYDLPKRKSHAEFTEITSANRDNSYPLAPDFTVHIDYGADFVVIYEDYGPGCVFRIYLFPALVREVNVLHNLKPRDMKDMYLLFSVDGVNFKYSLQVLLEGNEFPFLYPMSATHARPASGLGAYVPICYSKHVKISYIHNEPLPPRLLHTTVNCSANDLLCPTHIYSAVSRHKYRAGTQLKSFADINSYPAERVRYETMLKRYTETLKHPELNGPNKNRHCTLQCTRLCNGCRKTIYQHNSGGVIDAVNMRVYRTTFGHPKMLEDWNDILLTSRFDQNDESVPQLNQVPLGSLFGVTSSLNDFMGAAMGHRRKACSFDIEADLDFYHNFSEQDITGYFYFPMPYWKNASISIEGTKDTRDSTLVCYQFSTVVNHYDVATTAYFHASKRYYADDVTGWRSMLDVQDRWGHVVGVLTDVDNVRAKRNVPLNERWALLQSDHVLYLDSKREAAMMGTGLEDYFSYAHGFALAENTTYAYVGNYHAAPKRKEPLTWHCYRFHLLDPIPFQNQVQFVMEGTDRHTHFKQVSDISYAEYRNRLENEQLTETHLMFYYAQKSKTYAVLDSLKIGEIASEKNHSYATENTKLGSVFSKENRKFLGQVVTDESFTVSGRQFSAGDRIKFKLYLKGKSDASSNNFEGHEKVQNFNNARNVNFTSLVIRRFYYTAPFSWNQRAKIWVNGNYYGFWYSPMGTFSDHYSLRESELQLSIADVNIINVSKIVDIEIEAETDWNDFEYKLIGWS